MKVRINTYVAGFGRGAGYFCIAIFVFADTKIIYCFSIVCVVWNWSKSLLVVFGGGGGWYVNLVFYFGPNLLPSSLSFGFGPS